VEVLGCVYVYEDDGETQTEGFHFDIYWVLPLTNREYSASAVHNKLVHEAIMFKLDFDERIHDSQISSRFFSLYFCGIFKEPQRIDYNNDNMTLNSIITPINLFKITKKLIEYKKDKDLLNSVYEVFDL